MPISELRGTPETSEHAIQSMERRLKLKLPPEYRAFLLRTNGGHPYPEDAFRNDKVFSLLNLFYSVEHERNASTIEHARDAFIKRIPKDLLAIGVDAGGNRICIGIRRRNYGGIYFWSMADEEPPGKKPRYRNIKRIADSFDEFLEMFFDADQQ